MDQEGKGSDDVPAALHDPRAHRARRALRYLDGHPGASNREVAVALSAKGGALVARLIPPARDIEADANAGISPEELAVVKRCLRRMYANLTNRPAVSRSARPRRAAI